ncbi:MAG: phosphatidylcholine/phosphatidylserine synthase [Gammaproteobacteria bacterium]|nr:phosphatidylcholine/phosphatidylserine synthase [Gammaproteobacteria bacterium]
MQDSSPDPVKPTRKKNLRRGIYLLPNLFTTGALFAGFYAIIAAIKGQFEIAAIAVFIAMLLDGLDGRVARLTNTQSSFGAEYDSLADMASFGLTPALVVYQWSLIHLGTIGPAWGKMGWLAAFIFAASAALRLARFNTQIGTADKRFFQGLASPAAAAVIVSAVWVGEIYDISGQDVMFPMLVLTTVTGLLMVSRFSYYSFKDFDLKKRVPFIAVLMILLVFVLLSIETPTVLFGMSFLYMISGPVLTLFRWERKRRKLAQKKAD